MKVNRRFEGTCRFHLQGRGIRQSRNQREAGSKQSFSVDFQPTTRVISQKIELFITTAVRTSNPPKRRLTPNGLRDVISQKIELFMTTAVITSNPTTIFWLHILIVRMRQIRMATRGLTRLLSSTAETHGMWVRIPLGTRTCIYVSSALYCPM
jgi:hypothetical protein